MWIDRTKKLATHDVWIKNVDMDAFKEEMDALGRRLRSEEGAPDKAHLNMIINPCDILLVVGIFFFAGLGLSPAYVFPWVFLGMALTVRCTSVMHHISHGGYSTISGITSFADELSSIKALKSLPTQLYILPFLLVILSLLVWGVVPDWFFMMSFLIWRLAYNGGIGAMLYQSNGFAFSKWFRDWITKPQYKWIKEKLESGVVLKDGDKDIAYKMEEHSHEFNAWIVFRIVVNIILANDFVSYLVFAVVYFRLPESFGFFDILMYVIGAGLTLFGLWSKADAHGVRAGNFAWYSGDFFFTIESDLTFDGIFQMFPHPVGFCFYYGISLMSQSYVVFYTSVFVHILQMVFLIYVENPHIEKIYGQMSSNSEAAAETRIDNRKDILLFHLSPFRATDIVTILILIYSSISACSVKSWEWHLLHLVCWSFHTLALGYILRKQDTEGFWVKQFAAPQLAFDSWKKYVYQGGF